MPRRRFFIPQGRIRGEMAVLTPDEAHHLRDVLRLRAGEEVELLDGEGASYSGTIQFDAEEVYVGALRKLEVAPASATPIALAAALIKLDRFEWMLQKSAELGIDRILPLETHFSNTHIAAARLDARLERWQRIVREASKQCRSVTVPRVHAPVQFDALLADPEYSGWARFLLHGKAGERLAADHFPDRPVLLCVGPEGGWDDSEAAAAGQAGFRIVSLGTRVLRAETACLAAVAVFRFLLEK